MATIEQATNVDTSGYTRTLPVPAESKPEQLLLPVRDSKLRFSAPYLPGTFPSSDTLLGYHLGGMIPQYRIPVPPGATAGGAGGTTNNNVLINTSNSSSSTTITSNLGIIQSASFNVPSLNPGDVYTGSLTLSGEAWTLFGFTGTFPMRVRGYSTAAAQTVDLQRPITQAPGYGTEQGIIFDVYLDTPPISWGFTPTVTGNNQDEGESQIMYITVTNVSNASVSSGSVSFEYAPIAAFKDQV